MLPSDVIRVKTALDRRSIHWNVLHRIDFKRRIQITAYQSFSDSEPVCGCVLYLCVDNLLYVDNSVAASALAFAKRSWINSTTYYNRPPLITMWEPTTASAANRDEDPKNQKQQVDCSEIDSGFLSSEQILSGYSDSDYLDEAKREATSATLSVDRPRDNNIGEKQVEYLDSGLVESGVIEEDNKMLLERALDHGLSEWMCTLELGQHQTQQINNLSRKVDELSMSESAEEGHTMGRDRSRETVVEVPEEEQPWEVFYKQDAEGDT